MPYRVAILSAHTSPLAQPGSGNAGGMNVYVLQTALQLARCGIKVEIFTRAVSSTDVPIISLAPGVLVHNILVRQDLTYNKCSLSNYLCAFTAEVLRITSTYKTKYYDVIHSHYWLSGQIGWLIRKYWSVSLVYTAHTIAAIKNADFSMKDISEYCVRKSNEQHIFNKVNRLIVNTKNEAQQIFSIYNVNSSKTDIIHPGVNLNIFKPGDQTIARSILNLALYESIVVFVGRIQLLKAPDILIKAVAKLYNVRVIIVGGLSGNGFVEPNTLLQLTKKLGIFEKVNFFPVQPHKKLVDLYRAADLVAIPSYSESFGLVAIEAQACGTPVVASSVGGLPIAVANGVSGALVYSHSINDWASAIDKMLRQVTKDFKLASIKHATKFSWDQTVNKLINSYSKATLDYKPRNYNAYYK